MASDVLTSLSELETHVQEQGVRVDSLSLDLRTFAAVSLQRGSAGLEESLRIAQYCAPTLTALRLDGFHMPPPTADGAAASSFFDVLQACKSLRSLHVCMEAPAAPGGDSSGLLLQIAAALPQLRALQLRCPRKPGRQLRESHFSEEFVAQVAGGDLPGLQLLQLENCSFGGEELSLPGSLRFLSLKTEQAPSDAQLHVLLCACTAIEELYMTAFVTSNDKPPDLTALLPIAACLRTLVLDLPGVPVNITENSSLMPEWAGLPQNVPDKYTPAAEFRMLDVLVITNVCNNIDELPSKCPALRALALTMTDADFLFPLVKSHLHHKICPLQHLQLNLCIDLYVLVEHHVWPALGHIQNLRTLQLIFQDYDNQQDMDQQIVHLFKASLKLDGLAMPNLERLALYLDADAGCADPFFVYDPAKPYQACAALAPIGDMISGTVWPNVTQVELQPCFNAAERRPYEGAGPALEAAPHVKVLMHADKGLSLGSEFGLRAFIGSDGSDIDEPMRRAMDSLEIT